MPVEFIPNPFVGVEWEHSPEALAAVAALGEEVARKASDLAPVDTGALAASIASHPHGLTETARAEILAEVPYASFVEFGTSLQAAQPFLRPALDAVVGR